MARLNDLLRVRISQRTLEELHAVTLKGETTSDAVRRLIHAEWQKKQDAKAPSYASHCAGCSTDDPGPGTGGKKHE